MSRRLHISDGELQRLTVGERVPNNGPIVLAEYDPQWPQIFGHESAGIHAKATLSASGTRSPSGSFRNASGGMYSTTPTPRPR